MHAPEEYTFTNMTTWKLELLGKQQFHRQGAVHTIERNMAGMLAYLALKGPTVRTKLAGLLWPDSVESTARNNLAQTLRRIRQALADEVVVGDDILHLSKDVDVQTFKLLAFSGDIHQVVGSYNDLLGAFSYDDYPEIADLVMVGAESAQGAVQQRP